MKGNVARSSQLLPSLKTNWREKKFWLSYDTLILRVMKESVASLSSQLSQWRQEMLQRTDRYIQSGASRLYFVPQLRPKMLSLSTQCKKWAWSVLLQHNRISRLFPLAIEKLHLRWTPTIGDSYWLEPLDASCTNNASVLERGRLWRLDYPWSSSCSLNGGRSPYQASQAICFVIKNN